MTSNEDHRADRHRRVQRYVRQETRHHRGLVRVMQVFLIVAALAALCSSVYSLVTRNLAAVSGFGAMSLLALGIITPMLTLPLLVFHDRANDRWLWIALIVGGVIAALAPVAVLLVGGDWDTQVWFTGRWGSGSTLTLRGYLWLAGVPAVLMTAGGVVGLARGASRSAT